MNYLPTQLNASDRPTVVEAALELLDQSNAFARTPIDRITGDAITTLGPPTTGTRIKDELYVDAAYAVWRCTVAGTSGTWQQECPAVVSVDPSDPPADYVIARTAEHLKLYYWSGAAWIAV